MDIISTSMATEEAGVKGNLQALPYSNRSIPCIPTSHKSNERQDYFDVLCPLHMVAAPCRLQADLIASPPIIISIIPPKTFVGL
jgi:hypothetical protein